MDMGSEELYQVFQDSFNRLVSPTNPPHLASPSPNPTHNNMNNYQYQHNPQYQQQPQQQYDSAAAAGWNAAAAYPGAELDFPQQQMYQQMPDQYNGFGNYYNQSGLGHGVPPSQGVVHPATSTHPAVATVQMEENNMQSANTLQPGLQVAPSTSLPIASTSSSQHYPDWTNSPLPVKSELSGFDPSLDLPLSSPTSSVSTVTSGGPGRKRKPYTKETKGARGKKKKVDDDLDPQVRNAMGQDPEEMIDPTKRAQKEKDRRFSNNTRERMRIRDINEALAELGRVCMTLKPKGMPIPSTAPADANKPQTKLAVLNMAVEVISNLETKVRERNLNPQTLILQQNSQQMAQQQQQQQGNIAGQQMHPDSTNPVHGFNR